MAFLAGFGAYVPQRVVTNADVAQLVDADPQWIREVSGIDERRWAAPEETVVDMGVAAARECLVETQTKASELAMIIVSCGSTPRRFPGPAAQIAKALELDSTPAIDLPLASAGSLFGLALAAQVPGPTLVIATEKMSTTVLTEPRDKNTAILFGDGAGACLVRSDRGRFRVIDSLLQTDGSYAGDLQLPLAGNLQMNGRSVIMQASRKLPRVITDVLAKHAVTPADVRSFVLHQANQNLIAKVAQSAGAPLDRFYSNIHRYGNTSSASMLIAATEWSREFQLRQGEKVCFAAFGAGFHWGSLLAEATETSR